MKGLHIVEVLKLEKPKSIEWEYDEGADVLYISFGKPREALTMDLGSGILARYDKDSNKMIGFTITGLKSILVSSSWFISALSQKTGGEWYRPR